MNKTWSSIIIVAFAFLSLTGKTALANAPIGASLLLAYPTLFYSSLTALVLAISIESLVFHLMTKYHLIKSLLLIFVANILSSLIGFLIAVCYSSGDLFLIAFLPVSWGLSRMLKYLAAAIPLPRYILKFSFVIFIVLLWICLVLGALLLPLTDSYMRKHAPAPNIFAATLSSLIIISIGFLFTVLSEFYVIMKILSKLRQRVDFSTLKTAILMNLVSYILLSVVYGPAIINKLFNK